MVLKTCATLIVQYLVFTAWLLWAPDFCRHDCLKPFCLRTVSTLIEQHVAEGFHWYLSVYGAVSALQFWATRFRKLLKPICLHSSLNPRCWTMWQFQLLGEQQVVEERLNLLCLCTCITAIPTLRWLLNNMWSKTFETSVYIAVSTRCWTTGRGSHTLKPLPS